MSTTARLARPLLSAAASSFFALRAARGLPPVPPRPSDVLARSTSRRRRTASATPRDAIVCLVNAERTSRGLRPLRRDGDLAQAARKHSADMARRNYFSHVTPGGDDLGDRLRDAGYGDPGDGWRAGENLGWGTGNRATPAVARGRVAREPGAQAQHARGIVPRARRRRRRGRAAGATTALPGATYTLDLGVIRSG